MLMDETSWARHANPLSAYSRIIGGSLTFFAFWSVFWIGALSVIPIIIAVIWTLANPRLFAAPTTTQSWATRGVLGERVFLNRRIIPIPPEFTRIGHIATGISAVFLLFVVFAFWRRDFWLGLCAWHAMMLGKVWFVDRMACLWDVMKERDTRYRAWNIGDFSA